jgi:hypothetical protein
LYSKTTLSPTLLLGWGLNNSTLVWSAF